MIQNLRDLQRRRYARNILLPEIGERGQLKLLQSRVLVVGAGGLGAPLITYLAAAGVGTLGIADGDKVELSNLNRQILFETSDVGRLKAEAARNRVEELNPDVKVECHNLRLSSENAESIIANYDLVADGSDNFETRFLVSDVCMALEKPLVSAAVRGWEGQLATFKPYLTPEFPCYRCLVHSLPPEAQNCSENGVLGAFTGMLGTMQAIEAIKEIIGDSNNSLNILYLYDSKTMRLRSIELKRDPICKHRY